MAAAMTVSTLGTWEADGVTIAQVEHALGRLRQGERRAAVRTSVLTLVVVVTHEAAGRAALEVAGDLGGRSPSRVVVIVLEEGPEPEGAPIDAAASIQAVRHGSVTTSFDEIVLTVRGRARYHLDSLVEPLVLPDVPVVVWLPSDLPSPGDPLVAASDRIVVDSRAVAEEGDVDRRRVLPRIAVLGRRLPVADLSWIRLSSWRSLLAGHFENPAYRPFLGGIERVEVAGNYGPRHLLAGWLLRRLDLAPDQFELTPASHVSVRLHASHDGRPGVFAVERAGPARIVEAWAQVGDEAPVRRSVVMRRQWPALALAGALTRMGPDEPYRDALDGALVLVRDAP